jgi:hypothetical protein
MRWKKFGSPHLFARLTFLLPNLILVLVNALPGFKLLAWRSTSNATFASILFANFSPKYRGIKYGNPWSPSSPNSQVSAPCRAAIPSKRRLMASKHNNNAWMLSIPITRPRDEPVSRFIRKPHDHSPGFLSHGASSEISSLPRCAPVWSIRLQMTRWLLVILISILPAF